MEINRRSFLAVLAAPLLAPLAKLLPKPAAPVLEKGDVLSVAFAGHYSLTPVVYFWAQDGPYILDGDCKTVISHQPPCPYWHGQPPFVKLEAKDLPWSGFKEA